MCEAAVLKRTQIQRIQRTDLNGVLDFAHIAIVFGLVDKTQIRWLQITRIKVVDKHPEQNDKRCDRCI